MEADLSFAFAAQFMVPPSRLGQMAQAETDPDVIALGSMALGPLDRRAVAHEASRAQLRAWAETSGVDSPSIPIRVACGHLSTGSFNEPPGDVGIERPTHVEDEKVFLSRARWRLTLRIVDQLQVPGRPWPPKHYEGVSALGFGTGAVKDLESKTVDPRALGPVEVLARAADTQVTRRMRQHFEGIMRCVSAVTAQLSPGKLDCGGQACISHQWESLSPGGAGMATSDRPD